ncbi:hypothetical protein GCM10009665_24400 [Kitasatospora nipponensis]|uniref:DUF4232 domain-containing protein n=1 Tax=Kitasatospora nipponensis TaxID=258049 RepID=A0ABP4GPN6_9ACTN
MPAAPRTRRLPFAVPVAALGLTALAVTGCSSAAGPHVVSGGPATPAPATAAPSATPASPVPSAGASTTTAPSAAASAPATTSAPVTAPATGAPGTPSASASAAGPSACSSGRLGAALTDPGVGAGQYYATLVLTNTSDRACTLSGYPGVSYVAAAGVQSGNAAQRTGDPYTAVTLKPHGTARATLHDSNGIGGYDPAQCQLTAAQGLRVYPPGETHALFVPWRSEHCAGPTVHALTIGPLTS